MSNFARALAAIRHMLRLARKYRAADHPELPRLPVADNLHGFMRVEQVIEYALEAVAIERKRCAKLAEESAKNVGPFKHYENTYADGWVDASNELCWAIRGDSR